MIDSDDDDYELPSLAERIQASLKASSMTKPVKTFDSDSEESEFLQFSERIRNTPYSQVKMNFIDSSDGENQESGFLKFSERIRNTPCSPVKLKFTDSSDGENEESGFLKSSEKVQNTLSSEVKLKLHFSSSSSESDSEEAKFLKFSEKIRSTSQSQYGLKQHDLESDSDSDGAFTNYIKKFKEINTPKSQNKFNREAFGNTNAIQKPSLPNPSDFLGGKSTASEDMPKSCMDSRAENKKEYDSLFPSRSDDSLFLKKRAFYSKTLFEYFNRKIFNYQLSKDIPLIWAESLVKTAGLTYCKRKKNVYSCSIKLSSKLLTSFDRLQDTLLHEMCHAAVWMINKQDVSHGPLWQLWASRSKLILPFIDCPARCHNYDVDYRFWYQCPSCKWKRGTCRRSKKYNGAVCQRCKVPIILIVNN